MDLSAEFMRAARPMLAALLLALLPPAAAQEQPSPIPEDTVITLQRGNCEDGCPVYRVVVFEDGDVLLQGRARVRRPGVFSNRIPREQVRRLLRAFREIDYLHLADIYGYRGKGCSSSRPSMPMVTTSLSTGGESRTLTHHAGCVGEISDRLTALESEIDAAVGSMHWMSEVPPNPVDSKTSKP